MPCWRRSTFNLSPEEPFPKCIYEEDEQVCSHYELLADYGEYITCDQKEKGVCYYYKKAEDKEILL
jgi:hypothetical protein